MIKIVSTVENYLVSGLWLEIGKEVSVLEKDIEKYLHLNGVKVVTPAIPVETPKTAVESKIEIEIEN